jgi:hypothetical protein
LFGQEVPPKNDEADLVASKRHPRRGFVSDHGKEGGMSPWKAYHKSSISKSTGFLIALRLFYLLTLFPDPTSTTTASGAAAAAAADIQIICI